MMSKSEGNCCIRFFRNKARLYRYAALLCICLLGLGGFICFDSVGALQEVLMKYLEISASEFSWLYTVNTWPNVVICLFSGYLIDRYIGVKFGTIISTTMFSIGHMIFSLGIFLGLYWLSLVGRFIFGIGLEIMFICIQCYLVLWFRNNELSMVITLMFSLSRLGIALVYEMASPMNTSLQKHLDGSKAVGVVFFIIGIFTLLSILCGFILKSMDPYKYRKRPEEKESPGMDHSQGKKIKIKDVIHFPIIFWVLALSYSVFLTTIFGFIPFSQSFFVVYFDFSTESANNLPSFFGILSAVMAPLLGIVVDRVGRTVFFLIGGVSCVLLAHLLLTFSSASPFIAMFLLSLGKGMFLSSIVPMMALTIPQHQLGTAFGVNLSLVNTSYSVNLLVIGLLVDKHGYISMELYMLAWALLGLSASISLWFLDRRSKKILNLSPAQRKLLEQSESKKDETLHPLQS